MANDSLKYHFGFFIFVLLSSARNIFIADTLRRVDTLFFTFMIGLCIVLYTLVMRLWTIGWHVSYSLRQAAPIYMLLGCTTLIGFLGTNFALKSVSPILIALIDVSLYPVATSLIAYWFSRQETIRLDIVLPTLLVAIIGIVLFSLQSVEGHPVKVSLTGIVWELVSIMGWAASVVMISNLLKEGTPLIDVLGVRFIVTVIALGGTLLFSAPQVQNNQLPAIALIALGTFFIPYLISFVGLRKLSVVTFAIYTMLSPIMTYLLNAVFHGDWALSPLQVLGMTLTLAALSIRTVTDYRAAQQAISPKTRLDTPQAPVIRSLPEQQRRRH